MPNWNLKSFDNIYASLAESAYRDRPTNFAFGQLNRDQQNRLKKNKSVLFDFSKDAKDNKGQVTQGGGTDLPNQGKVYLQPDNEGLLEDKKTGYNAYYVTDTVLKLFSVTLAKCLEIELITFLVLLDKKISSIILIKQYKE